MTEPALIARWRADTPGITHRIHLNNAGAGLMPAPVLLAMTDHLRLEARIGGYEAADLVEPAIRSGYQALARLIETLPRNIAVVENATVAVSQALSAFDFVPGDVIVTTEADYVSNQLMLLSLAQRRGVVIRRAADRPTGGVDPDSLDEICRDPRVRLVVLSWIPTNSGLIQDAEAAGEICARRGIPYLVDACQAVGQLPVDVRRLRCDFLAATGRKFLRGPRGIGFLYVSDRMLDAGRFPLFLDLRGGVWTDPDRFEIAPGAERFENWEFAYASPLGLGEAARYAGAAQADGGFERSARLGVLARQHLAGLPGVTLLDRGPNLGAIATANVAGRSAGQLIRALRERGINSSAFARSAAVIDLDRKQVPDGIRVSAHYYNTEAELATFGDELGRLLRT